MRFMTKLALLGSAAYAAKRAYDNFAAQRSEGTSGGTPPSGDRVRVGYDTPTGADPNAKYTHPGYEDKSFGQAVNEDQELVDRLVRDSDGDLDDAAIAFRNESAGAPALERQEHTQE